MINTAVQLPEAFVDRLRSMLTSSDFTAIMSSFESQKSTTFRINTLKCTENQLLDVFTKQNMIVQKVPGYTNAFILTSPTLRELTDTDMYKQGLFYVQSLSSMIPAMVLEPQSGEKILDLCAAPGSKTTQIAALMDNHGEIIANDTSPVRGYRLKANLDVQGVTITRQERLDGRSLWQKYPEYFDRTLVDVPCSMEGRFITSEPKSYEHWSVKKVKELAHLQRFLLRSAVSATKPGGTIVYSTCTLSPEENEDVIDWLLSKEKTHIEIEKIEQTFEGMKPGLTHWMDKEFDTRVSNCIRIYPTKFMEGFFISKIRKVSSSIPAAFVR